MDQSRQALARIEEAIKRRDGLALGHAAHSLKGSVSNFGADGACNVALKLEELGQEGELTQADQPYPKLEREIHSLTTALAEFVARTARSCFSDLASYCSRSSP